jgi:Protein of unknown function DUF58
MAKPATKDDPRKYLDPRTLAKVRSLELKARLIVEGYLSGQHKSPYHGFSVEFAQHREYVPGDDIKHIDWKVWGRTGRFYLKQYEEETNLVCWIMLDISESMKYGSIDGMSKFDYACMAAAALAYLVLHQSDAVGFVAFDSQITSFLKPSSQMGQLKEMVHIMNQGVGREKSNMAPLFHDMAERVNRRSIIFLLSDMFEDLEPILSGPSPQAARGGAVEHPRRDGADLPVPGIDALPRHGGIPRPPDRPALPAQGLSGADRGLHPPVAERLPRPEHRLRATADRHAPERGAVELSGASPEAITLTGIRLALAAKRRI